MKLTPNWSLEEDHNDAKGTSLIGRIVYCHCEEPKEHASYCLSTAHIIGWDSKEHSKKTPALTFTSLSDGMTTRYSPEELIDLLNRQPYLPMPATALYAAIKYKCPKS